MTNPARVSLADAVQVVRSELNRAATLRGNDDLLFRVGSVELEFTVDFKAERGDSAGVKAWVISVDDKQSVVEGTTHKLRVTLEPHRSGVSADIASEVHYDPDRIR